MPSIFQDDIKHLAPRPRISVLKWVRENVFTHERRPYSHGDYPHLGAPGGPFNAFDDPRTTTIWLQFATRCGKTFFGLCCLLFIAAISPCSMMFASSTEKLSVDVIARFYKMLEYCKALAKQLRPEARRRQDRVDLAACRVWVAWARSVSTLADKAVKVGLANEIDKWEHLKTSKEADPVSLFDERFKEYPSHKKIKEGTPQIKGQSRIERGLLGSTNCRYHVPCPHCQQYQTLDFKRVRWQKTESGKDDRDLALKTAYYECLFCSGHIHDHHRGPMMRLGVWAPEGCTVRHEEAMKTAKNRGSDGANQLSVWKGWSQASWIDGSPARDGTDAGYQMSSLYALSLGWGQIAAEFIRCKDRPQLLRNFINSWLGETWEIRQQKQTWEKLGERIIDHSIRRGIVPDWASFLTIGVDRQQEPPRLPWVVDAWGPGRRSHTIAYSEAELFADLSEVLRTEWKYEDGNGSLKIVQGLCDSGFRPDGVYEFCLSEIRRGVFIWPAKGSNHALPSDYQRAILGPNTSMPGMALYHVDTIRSQLQIDRQLHTLQFGDEGCTSVYSAPLEEHQDFLEQLLNDAAVSKLDAHNNARESWDRIESSIPNDFRDCKRYAWTAMLMWTRGQPIKKRGESVRIQVPQRPSPPSSQSEGSSWINLPPSFMR